MRHKPTQGDEHWQQGEPRQGVPKQVPPLVPDMGQAYCLRTTTRPPVSKTNFKFSSQRKTHQSIKSDPWSDKYLQSYGLRYVSRIQIHLSNLQKPASANKTKKNSQLGTELSRQRDWRRSWWHLKNIRQLPRPWPGGCRHGSLGKADDLVHGAWKDAIVAPCFETSAVSLPDSKLAPPMLSRSNAVTALGDEELIPSGHSWPLAVTHLKYSLFSILSSRIPKLDVHRKTTGIFNLTATSKQALIYWQAETL